MSQVSDYVTLFRQDAKLAPHRLPPVVSGILEWDIPASAYYYQNRGSLCLVSLADASINTDGQGGAQGMTIWYEGAMTGGITKARSFSTTSVINNNCGCLGIGRYKDDDNEGDRIPSMYHFSQGGAEPVKLLCAARPSMIRLHFYESDKNLFSWDTGSSQDGVFMLRFDYLDPILEHEKNEQVSYTPAF